MALYGIVTGIVAALASATPREAAPETALDPYAELKTRIHHTCIAKLGPELFSSKSNEDLTDRVLRVVTEQLALDQTPLTRDERRQVVAAHAQGDRRHRPEVDRHGLALDPVPAGRSPIIRRRPAAGIP